MDSTNSVHIRLLEKRDEQVAFRLIWEQVFIKTIWKIWKANIGRFLITSILIGIASYCYSESMKLSLLTCFSYIPIVTIFIRFIYLYILISTSVDLWKGLFDYWRQNEVGRRFWVAEVDNCIVGTCAVEQISPNTAQLHRVVTVPGMQRKGIARMMVQHAMDDCKKRGFSRICLTTSGVQTAAQRFIPGWATEPQLPLR